MGKNGMTYISIDKDGKTKIRQSAVTAEDLKNLEPIPPDLQKILDQYRNQKKRRDENS